MLRHDTNSEYIHKSMPPIFSTRAQTQHPGRQPECECECNRDDCLARFLLAYSIVSQTIRVKTVNSHRDMNPWCARRLRCLIPLFRLIGYEGSRYGLPSLERHSQYPLPSYLQTPVHYQPRPCSDGSFQQPWYFLCSVTQSKQRRRQTNKTTNPIHGFCDRPLR